VIRAWVYDLWKHNAALGLRPIWTDCDGEINAMVEGSKFRESHVLKREECLDL
jgi:hypothetical protein